MMDNPWHTIGKEFETATTLQDALAITCPWNVGAFPVYGLIGTVSTYYKKVSDTEYEDFQLPDFRLIEGYQEIWRQSPQGSLNTLQISPTSYEVVDNQMAFGWLEPLIKTGLLELDSSVVLNQGKVIMFCCRVAESKSTFTLGTDDNLELRFYMATSHDGTVPISVGKLGYKLENYAQFSHIVNGTVQEKDVLTFRHTLNIEDRLTEARDFILMSIKEFEEETVPIYVQLKGIRFTQDDFNHYCTELFKEELKGRPLEKYKAWSKINAIYNHSDSLVGLDFSGYRAYMALCEYWSQHSGGMTEGNIATRLKSSLFGLNKVKSQKALEIMLRYLTF